MQDNISCALITAFERQYDTSWDDPKLRNERLAMRYGWTAAMEAKQCLHQIQEPAAAEQAAWHAGLDEGRAQEAPAAVAVPTQALTGEARAEKIRGLAPIRAKLSAAADVAVPDGWHAPGLGEVHNEDHTQMIYCADGDGVASDDLARKVRAALAATPAPDAQVPQGSYVSTSGELKPDVSVYSTPAAAPVVLPEPDAVISELMGLVDEWGMESHLRGAAELDAQHSEATQEEIDCAKDRASKERAAWKAIESKLRTLLATATGLPAQAVPAFCHVASLKLKNLQERGYQITGYAIEKPVEGAQPERGFINHGGFVGWWWDGQSPLLQPSALDALTPAARDVLAERQRQITHEGYDPQHDDDHMNDEIAAMAALFIMPEGARDWDATSTSYGDTLAEAILPCDWEMPNFDDDRRRQLVKGTAMGLAEIERIDRAAIAAAKGEGQ